MSISGHGTPRKYAMRSGKTAIWWKINILSFNYHVKDFNLLFLKLLKFCVYDTYNQSYVLSKLTKNNEKT